VGHDALNSQDASVLRHAKGNRIH